MAQWLAARFGAAGPEESVFTPETKAWVWGFADNCAGMRAWLDSAFGPP